FVVQFQPRASPHKLQEGQNREDEADATDHPPDLRRQHTAAEWTCSSHQAAALIEDHHDPNPHQHDTDGEDDQLVAQPPGENNWKRVTCQTNVPLSYGPASHRMSIARDAQSSSMTE